MGETGVFEQTSRGIDVFLSDLNATRQDPERALEHAHVLIEGEMRDIGGAQERLDNRKENRVIAANELAHARLLRLIPQRRAARLAGLAYRFYALASHARPAVAIAGSMDHLNAVLQATKGRPRPLSMPVPGYGP